MSIDPAISTAERRRRRSERAGVLTSLLQVGLLIAVAVLAAEHPDLTRAWVDRVWLYLDRLH